MLPTETYINHFIEIWKNSSNKMPVFIKEFSEKDKLLRENSFNSFQKKIKELRSPKKAQQFRTNPKKLFFPMFKRFLETVFDFKKSHLNIIMSDNFKNVSKVFFNKARVFGPELEPENIYQGLRNVWIMNGIQLIMEVPVKITPSVFAYSMIYPYSDNLLDTLSVTTEEKQQFCERFNNRLHGDIVIPQTFAEKQLFKLASMFEEEFARSNFPKVYESLYAIQQAQTNSLKLIIENNISDTEIMNIVFDKGGTSVLADGYLVAGKITREQEQALFGYGIYLQLLDDIQDLKEDSETNTKTMFSNIDNKNLGELVNKTINFGRTILQEMKCFPGAENGEFLDLMNRSIELMIIESVGINSSWYTEKYLTKLEKYSPLHFQFVRDTRTQSKSQRFTTFQKYFS